MNARVVEGRRRVVGLGARTRRELPDDGRATIPTTTAPSTARPRPSTKGLLRSFNDMYGLDYVALRYFNVYGPRMDVYGAYTEVFIRWMERIAAGQPPLIFGDGRRRWTSSTSTTSPAPTSWRRSRTSPTRCSTSPAAPRPACANSPQMLLQGHGLLAAARARAEARKVNAGAAAAGRSTEKAERHARLRGRRSAGGGPARPGRLVARRARGDDGSGGMSQSSSTVMIPVAKPVLDEREVEAVRRVILSGWVTQGPEVAAFEREFAEYVGAPHACAVSNCTTALHLALLAVGVGPGDEVITVSHSFIATANAIRYCGATPVFVDIEAGRLQHRSGADRGGDHAADQGDPRASTRSACRATSSAIVAIGKRRRHAGDRGRRLRHRQRDSVGRTVGEDRQAAWRHRLLLLPSPQGGDHRRWRHADDREPRIRPQVPAVAPARHERHRHRAARLPRRSSSRPIRSSATTTG